MSTALTKFNQVSTFDIVKGILRADSTLNQKFRDDSYYEFFPKVKANDFSRFPFIVIEIPDAQDELSYLGNLTAEKTFTTNITMINEFSARSNVKTYANRVLATIRSAATTFRANGYELITITLEGPPEVSTISQKDVVITSFELTLNGEVKV